MSKDLLAQLKELTERLIEDGGMSTKQAIDAVLRDYPVPPHENEPEIRRRLERSLGFKGIAGIIPPSGPIIPNDPWRDPE